MNNRDYQVYEKEHGIELPKLIRENYIYSPKYGHCVECLLKDTISTGKVNIYNYKSYLVPVPILRVLQDNLEVFQHIKGKGRITFAIRADVEYDEVLGLIIGEEYVEF